VSVSHIKVTVCELGLATLHLVSLQGALYGGVRSKRRLARNEVLHFLLQLYVDSLLVLHLSLVHFDLLRPDCQLLGEGVSVGVLQLSHLAGLEEALKFGHPALERTVFLLNDNVVLAHGKKLSLYLVELVSQCLQVSLLLLVGPDQRLRVIHHLRKLN